MDYKSRMKKEYIELKDRTRKLKLIIDKEKSKELEFKLNCPAQLLVRQYMCMNEYLKILEMRMQLEDIEI